MRGLVIGRFQPLHKGHEQLIRSAIEDCVDVVVGIGSSEAPVSMRNPFSFDERKAMLHAVFPGVDIVAIPDIHDAPRWVAHVLTITGDVDKVYGNHERDLALFEDAGLRVVSPGLQKREEWEATEVRMRIAEGDASWRKIVPATVVPILEQADAEKRLRLLEARA